MMALSPVYRAVKLLSYGGACRIVAHRTCLAAFHLRVPSELMRIRVGPQRVGCSWRHEYYVRVARLNHTLCARVAGKRLA